MATKNAKRHNKRKRISHGLDFEPEWQYAPAVENTEHAQIQDQYGLFIGGKFCTPRDNTYFATYSPSTEQALAEVAEAGVDDVDRAVRSARRAYETSWSRVTIPMHSSS